MSDLLAATLAHLRALVAFDTRNPPRLIDGRGMFDYVREQLPGFQIEVTDYGAGAVTLHAVRGNPRLLFNVHLDTVPDSPHWSADPHTLRVSDDRAIGLGACDIKGAAAALLAVAAASDGPLALLFSTDEEANDARCIAGFLASASARERAYDAVIVAEPTRCEAVLAHRGIQSVLMRFAGQAGHASAQLTLTASALHQAVRWGDAALDFVAGHAEQRFGELVGLRFNIGRIEGGIKANMIAPSAELRFGFRALPSMDPDQLLSQFRGMALCEPAEFVETFRGPSLPSGDVASAGTRREQAAALATELDLPLGAAVDFWTEASLFSAAGYTAFVYGPGDIAQAHSADEWVALDQLHRYAHSILQITSHARA